MPAWPGELPPDARSQSSEPTSPVPSPLEPAVPRQALQPEVVGGASVLSGRRRSTMPEARERLAAKADAAAEAILDMAGLGDPERAAADEAVRGQMLRDAADRMGLSMPQVSVQALVIVDQESALADLERILGVAE